MNVPLATTLSSAGVVSVAGTAVKAKVPLTPVEVRLEMVIEPLPELGPAHWHLQVQRQAVDVLIDRVP